MRKDKPHTKNAGCGNEDTQAFLAGDPGGRECNAWDPSVFLYIPTETTKLQFISKYTYTVI